MCKLVVAILDLKPQLYTEKPFDLFNILPYLSKVFLSFFLTRAKCSDLIQSIFNTYLASNVFFWNSESQLIYPFRKIYWQVFILISVILQDFVYLINGPFKNYVWRHWHVFILFMAKRSQARHHNSKHLSTVCSCVSALSTFLPPLHFISAT